MLCYIKSIMTCIDRFRTTAGRNRDGARRFGDGPTREGIQNVAVPNTVLYQRQRAGGLQVKEVSLFQIRQQHSGDKGEADVPHGKSGRDERDKSLLLVLAKVA